MNKAERQRMDRIHRMGCIACGRRPVDAHHLVDKGYRKHSGGHGATIPLCAWCHRGEPIIGVSVKYMTLCIGPSLAVNKRAFVAKYGTERELIAKVDAMLGKSPTRDSG